MEASCFVAALLAVLAIFAGLSASGCATARGSVGAILGKDVHDGRLYVREVPPGMAAALAGIRDGDEVIAIDGEPVGDMTPEMVHRRLEGPLGSKVVLLVVRAGETKRVEVVRAPLASSSPAASSVVIRAFQGLFAETGSTRGS